MEERAAQKTKAIAYITSGDRLLVFEHTDFPDAGVQVPAGTVEQGESPREAVLREAREETGLERLRLVRYLGERTFDLQNVGRTGVEQRHFFHLVAEGELSETWRHAEMDPSDGSPAPIWFRFYWVSLRGQMPVLSGDQAALLGKVWLERADSAL